MQLNVTGHHVEVTDALRDYVSTKMQRIEKHYDHVTNVHCILTVDKLRHKAEATANLRGARIILDTVTVTGTEKEKQCDHHAREAQKSP